MSGKELYSRDLSPEAKKRLIDFLEAYIETLLVKEVDERAEVAKKKAIEALNTDIDIFNFVTILWTLREHLSLIVDVINKRSTSRVAAKLLVEMFDEGRKLDKALRLLPPGSGIRFS